MVKQQRRADRSFLPAAGDSVARVRFPVSPLHRRNFPHSSNTTEEERGDAAADGETKRARMDGRDEAAALTNREAAPGSCGQTGSENCSTTGRGGEQQEAAESDDSRAAELQTVCSLQVTIQQRSDSREFRQTDRSAERQTGPHCHVCDLTCSSLQVFQEHMVGSEHLRKLKEMTHSITLNTHTLQDRGRQTDSRRWCDTCQTHFSGDVIIHRRNKQHKMCKQLCRPFCPVCKRHFRTPRKFVEHMKSTEHKEQEAVREDYDPNTIYGSSFILPVSGFVCRLCNKFFYKETTARHTHCRTHTHYLLLQSVGAQRKHEDQDASVSHNASVCPGE
ncbi:cdkn1a interacting zinc finger protein 1b [Centropristis striata]|uniref:cdkn1a interacting zinc finger protein 1b n=1 Tax=Centropristis striata TaxID=184440 RepID=UPI0027E0ABF3|nr:cdkn1a interacting zinc finger protein 1b [Centropristis striata]